LGNNDYVGITDSARSGRAGRAGRTVAFEMQPLWFDAELIRTVPLDALPVLENFGNPMMGDHFRTH
jgi:hypothetical protein